MDGPRGNNSTAASKVSDDISVPSGAPPWVTPELIAATLRTWQPRYHEKLTSLDALEILLNVARIFEILEERDEQQTISGAGPGQQP